MKSAVYTGTLIHARRSPARHVFRYPVSYWLFDLDELQELARRLRLFSVNRRNVVSLRDRDHFDGTTPLKQAVVEFAGDPTISVRPVSAKFSVLPGDFNGDGVVNSQDMVGVRNEILGLAPLTIFGDINGDGKVDIKDYNAVRSRIATTLPAIA